MVDRLLAAAADDGVYGSASSVGGDTSTVGSNEVIDMNDRTRTVKEDLTDVELFCSVFRREPLPTGDEEDVEAIRKEILKTYVPYFKHPLPRNEQSYDHEEVLRRITLLPKSKQVRMAAARGNAWVLEELYLSGLPVDERDVNGYTPLHLAAGGGYADCIMVLLRIGMDVNQESTAGFTPLHMAVGAGHIDCAVLLRENGGLMKRPTKVLIQHPTVLDVDVRQIASCGDRLAAAVNAAHEHSTL